MNTEEEVVVHNWKEWVPDEPQPIFFQERKDGLQKEKLLLTSAEIQSDEAGTNFSWKITVLCDKDAYQRMESERWFGIPVGFANWYEANFQPDLPIQLIMEFQEWGMLDLMYPLPSTDLLDCLSHLLLPLTDEQTYELCSCSLAYRILDVRQHISEEESIGFSAETIMNAGF